MHRLTRFASIAALATIGTGCADPCFDDGLAQGGCPTADTEAGTTVADPTSSGGVTLADTSGTATVTTDPTAGTGNADGYVCPELTEVLLPQTPTFQLVVDRSGSMDEDFGGTSRWDALEDTLVGPDGVVTQLQSEIRFGLTTYTNTGMCPTTASLEPRLDGANDIAEQLDLEGPQGETPTGESIPIATALLLDDTWVGEKIIVLATDGEPDTCSIPDPMGGEVDEVRGVAVAAVEAAFAEGIRTFVISVGQDLAAEHLQDLANAGVGNVGDPPAEFWVANDTAALVAAFDEIVAGVRPCDFELAAPLMEELAPSCEVTVNGSVVDYQGADGWTLADQDTLELVGTACEAIQTGVAFIELTCACEPQ